MLEVGPAGQRRRAAVGGSANTAPTGRSARDGFNEVLDRNIVKMNDRFSETSTCLVELANIYSINFSS